MVEAAVKGSIVKSVFDLLKQKHSLEAVLDGLPASHREIFSGVIITGGWYPIEAYLDLLDRIVEHHDDRDLALCYQLGQKVVQDGLGTIYKIFVKLSNPEAVLKRSPMLWGMYFQGSEVSIVESDAQSAKVAIRESCRVTAPFCMSRMGGMHAVAVAANGKDPHLTHPECRLHGDARCLFDLKWE